MLSMLLLIDLMSYLGRTHVICAIVLAIIGISITALATRIITAKNKGEKPVPGDVRVIILKSVGLVFIALAMVCAAIPF